MALLDPRDNSDLLAKVAEEHGELARAYLQLRNMRSREGKTKDQIRKNIVEECIDVAIVAIELALRYGDEDEALHYLHLKLAKRTRLAEKYSK